jgi:hypothetical protein
MDVPCPPFVVSKNLMIAKGLLNLVCTNGWLKENCVKTTPIKRIIPK